MSHHTIGWRVGDIIRAEALLKWEGLGNWSWFLARVAGVLICDTYLFQKINYVQWGHQNGICLLFEFLCIKEGLCEGVAGEICYPGSCVLFEGMDCLFCNEMNNWIITVWGRGLILLWLNLIFLRKVYCNCSAPVLDMGSLGGMSPHMADFGDCLWAAC